MIDAALGGTDPGLMATRQRLAELNSEYTSLAQTYGSAYPRVVTLKAQIDQLKRELSMEEKAQVVRSEKDLMRPGATKPNCAQKLDHEEQAAFGKGEEAIQYELARQTTKQIGCFTMVFNSDCKRQASCPACTQRRSISLTVRTRRFFQVVPTPISMGDRLRNWFSVRAMPCYPT